MTLVIALGGNALLDPTEPQTIENQQGQIDAIAPEIAELLRDHDIILTHGNGPQVGNLLRQQEQTPPRMPLDILVAETQAQIGYMLTQALEKEGMSVPTVLTRVEVDPDSPAFDDPSKPVGPFLTADDIEDRPGIYKELGGDDAPYRRVVPSPEPRHVKEYEQISDRLEEDDGVIACGGGGIPVTPDGDGVEAVIDKDASSAQIAEQSGADILVLLTDVPYVYRHYGTDDQEPIETIHIDETDPLEIDGLGEGSMRPKVKAAKAFVEATGNDAMIGSVENIETILDGEGTRITR